MHTKVSLLHMKFPHGVATVPGYYDSEGIALSPSSGYYGPGGIGTHISALKVSPLHMKFPHGVVRSEGEITCL